MNPILPFLPIGSIAAPSILPVGGLTTMDDAGAIGGMLEGKHLKPGR